MKIRKNIQSMYVKKCCEEKHVDLLLIGEWEKNIMFLSMISIDSCLIIYYIPEENIFVIIFCILSLQRRFLSVILIKSALTND